MKARNGEFHGAGSATRLGFRLENIYSYSRLRKGDGGSKTIRSGTDDCGMTSLRLGWHQASAKRSREGIKGGELPTAFLQMLSIMWRKLGGPGEGNDAASGISCQSGSVIAEELSSPPLPGVPLFLHGCEPILPEDGSDLLGRLLGEGI